MTEPAWSARVRARIVDRPLVLVGIGPDQLRAFADAGGRVVGAISVVPAGGPDASPPARPATSPALGCPVLTVTGASRDILDHVVAGYAIALDAAHLEVAAFLDRVDPGHRATVASYLPLPHAVLGGRRCWTADAARAAALERKDAAADVLAACVPTIPSIPMPAGPATGWWDDACRTLGAEALVVQRAGLSGGGTGTWRCTRPGDVPDLDAGIVLPFVDGTPANVMGVVQPSGATAVLPASRQLVRFDDAGQPLYAGNVTGEPWTTEHRSAIAEEVRSLGHELWRHGFVGPFGADFVCTTGGGRRYHDLNPRMNGVADNLRHVLDHIGPTASDTPVPLVTALLSCTEWTTAEVGELEDFAHRALSDRPVARLWLTTVNRRRRVIEAPPRAGRWRVVPAPLTVTPADREGSGIDRIDGIDGDLVELEPLLPPGTVVEPGDRLALGNLYCQPALAAALTAALGDDAGPALVDAFLA